MILMFLRQASPRVPSKLAVAAIACTCVSVTSCTMGLQQAAIMPPISGSWQFSGVDMTVHPPPDRAGKSSPLDVSLNADHDTATFSSVTQLSLGFDLPWARMVIAPALVGRDDLEFIQLDLLYKHLLPTDSRYKWRLLAGFSFLFLNAGVTRSQALTLAQPIALDKMTVRTGDTVTYTNLHTSSAWNATVGVEAEIFEWLHVFLQTSFRMTESNSSNESLTLSVNDSGQIDSNGRSQAATVNLLTDSRFATDVRQPGRVDSSLHVPPFTALLGLGVTWPTFGNFKRLFGFGAEPAPAPPALERPLPEQPEDAPPPQPQPPPRDLPPDGYPTSPIPPNLR